MLILNIINFVFIFLSINIYEHSAALALIILLALMLINRYRFQLLEIQPYGFTGDEGFSSNCDDPACVRCNLYQETLTTALQSLTLIPDRSIAEKIEYGINSNRFRRRGPPIFHYSGLDSNPFLQTQQISDCRRLEDSFGVIKSEYNKIGLSQVDQLGVWQVNRTPNGAWDVFHLIDQGVVCENAKLCPRTMNIIHSLDSVMAKNVFGNAMFCVVKPGTIVQEHYGPSNVRLRCHLGLHATPQCILSVEDDSFLHPVAHFSEPDGQKPKHKSKLSSLTGDTSMEEEGNINFSAGGNSSGDLMEERNISNQDAGRVRRRRFMAVREKTDTPTEDPSDSHVFLDSDSYCSENLETMSPVKRLGIGQHEQHSTPNMFRGQQEQPKRFTDLGSFMKDAFDKGHVRKDAFDRAYVSKDGFDKGHGSKVAFDRGHGSKVAFDKAHGSKVAFDKAHVSKLKDAFDGAHVSKVAFDRAHVSKDAFDKAHGSKDYSTTIPTARMAQTATDKPHNLKNTSTHMPTGRMEENRNLFQDGHFRTKIANEIKNNEAIRKSRPHYSSGIIATKHMIDMVGEFERGNIRKSSTAIGKLEYPTGSKMQGACGTDEHLGNRMGYHGEGRLELPTGGTDDIRGSNRRLSGKGQPEQPIYDSCDTDVNPGDSLQNLDRVVLIVDLWHPHLSTAERNAIDVCFAPWWTSSTFSSGYQEQDQVTTS